MSKTVYSIYECSKSLVPTWLLHLGHPDPEKPTSFYPWAGIAVKFSQSGSTPLTYGNHWEYEIIGDPNRHMVDINFMLQSNYYTIHYLKEFLTTVNYTERSAANFRSFIGEKFGRVTEVPFICPPWCQSRYEQGIFEPVALWG